VPIVPALRFRCLAIAVLTTACAGTATTTTDALRVAAEEFSVSADRALTGTRFEDLGDDWLTELLVGACDDLAAGLALEPGIADAVADVPDGPSADDEILAVVIGEGVGQVCPDAARIGSEAAVDGFVDAALRAAAGLGLEVDTERVLQAGATVCLILADGGGAEDAVLAELGALFGVADISLGDLSASGVVTEPEGLFAGAVLGSAVSFFCPQHRDTVDAYLRSLGE
jgi:hypothetical protein